MKKYNFNKLPKDWWGVDMQKESNHPRINEFIEIWVSKFDYPGYKPDLRYAGAYNGVWNSWSEHASIGVFKKLTLDQFFELIEEPEQSATCKSLSAQNEKSEYIPKQGDLVIGKKKGADFLEEKFEYVTKRNGWHICQSPGFPHFVDAFIEVKPYIEPDELSIRLDELVSAYKEKGIKLIATFENI